MEIFKKSGTSKCPKCGARLRLDDVDFHFKGCCDNYWVCDDCPTSCIEKIRYGKPIIEVWHSEKLGVEDWSVYVR